MPAPNILIFMSDQQRADSIPPYSRAKTPNLDAFCAEGVTFTQAYCPSPHCCPSRATFFTGLYPSEHGVWNNVDVGNTLSKGLLPGTKLWSDDLRESGYSLDFTGKWHISAVETPEDYGWNMQAQLRIQNPQEAADPRPHMREWEGYKHLATQPEPTKRGEAQILRPGYSTYTHYGEDDHPILRFDRSVVDSAVEILKARKTEEMPWCHFVGTLGPHDPYFVPQEFLDLYPLEEIELPESFSDLMTDKPALYRRTRDRFDQLTEREQREALRHYLAFCTYEDALFGEVLQALDASGQADNTIVIYLSDHGDYAGEHGLWAKGLPCFNSAYHVPCVMRWPGQIEKPGRNVDEFVSLADFAPTLLDVAEVESKREFTGASLMQFLKNETPEDWRDTLFTQTNGNELYGIQRSVRTKEWKYIYNGFDYDELYDLQADPHQTLNLINNPAYKETVKELCQRMWRFAYEHGDVPINEYIMVAHAPYGPKGAFGN